MKNYIVSTTPNYWSQQVRDSISLDNSGLNWDVQKMSISAHTPMGDLPLSAHQSIHRMDTLAPIGMVGVGYEPIQNSQMWEAMHESLAGVDHKVVGSGYINGGARVFIQTQIDDQSHTVNGDKFGGIVTFFSSHDGSSAFEIFDTSVRIICQNTLHVARSVGGRAIKLKVRHTKSAGLRFMDVQRNLEQMFVKRQQLYAGLRELSNEEIHKNSRLAFNYGFFNRTDRVTTVSANKAMEASDLAVFGDGNRGVSLYDTFNGITQLLTRGSDRSQRDRGDIWASSEFGNAATQKAEAFKALVTPTVRHHLVQRGFDLINTGETKLEFALN